jgi:ferredoxin
MAAISATSTYSSMSQITLQDGTTFEFDGQHRNLLTALEQQKQEVNFHCRAGFCGACRCKLISGTVLYLEEPLAFVRKGEFLPCCSVPQTDLIIEIPQ